MNRIKTMLGIIAIGGVSMSSCKKLPPVGNLSDNFVVETRYDTAVRFENYNTFAIRDTIAVATENPKDSLWYDSNAQSIITEVIKNMQAKGYKNVGLSEHPDLGIQLIGVRNVYLYGISPGYWWGYPGYVGPCYWGHCNDYPYWYPYWYSYSVSTGTLVVEMADLKNAEKDKKVEIVWSALGSGQIGDSKTFALDQCIRTVDQAFAQSSYLEPLYN